jgi:Tfp pilus assembly protein FimT
VPQSCSGFTLIEIVLLSILAALALPRFVDLEREAGAAKVDSIAGGVDASLGSARALFLVRGNRHLDQTQLTVQGQWLTLAAGCRRPVIAVR